MKRSIYLMAVTALSVFVWSSSSLAEDKIGFINIQEIVRTSQTGKKAMEEFKKLYDNNGREIKSSEEELKKMKVVLEKQGSLMTQDSRNEKEYAYEKKMRDYKLLVDDKNEELEKQDREITQKLIPQVIKIVRSIAEKEKYSLIIDVATTTVPYYDKSNDITQKVIEEFNKTK